MAWEDSLAEKVAVSALGFLVVVVGGLEAKGSWAVRVEQAAAMAAANCSDKPKSRSMDSNGVASEDR